MWHRADIENMETEVSNKLADLSFDPSDIDKNWSTFRDILSEAQDKYVPHKMSTLRHNLPWYNQKLRRLSNKKQRLYNKMKKSGSKEDIKAFKSCRIEHRKLLKSAQNDYYLDFLEPKLDNNSKFLFNHIKRLRKDSVGIEALKLNGIITTDSSDKAEALAQQYESVFVEDEVFS